MKPLSEWQSEANYTVVSGNRIAYWTASDEVGSKPALLLIHGFPTSSWDWTAIWPTLASHFRLIAIDMLGFGLSDKPRDAAYSIASQADILMSILKRLDVKDVHIIAHDYGNTVAQEILARSDEGSSKIKLGSIIFLNGGLFPEQHRARPIQKLGLTPLGFLLGAMFTRKRLRKSFDEIFGADTPASDTEIETHWKLINVNGGRRILHRLLSYIPQRRAFRERWVGALQQTKTPIRLINGGADPVSGEHLYHYYRQMISNADAVILKEIGHYPQTEAPTAVLAHILEFYRRLGAIEA